MSQPIKVKAVANTRKEVSLKEAYDILSTFIASKDEVSMLVPKGGITSNVDTTDVYDLTSTAAIIGDEEEIIGRLESVNQEMRKHLGQSVVNNKVDKDDVIKIDMDDEVDNSNRRVKKEELTQNTSSDNAEKNEGNLTEEQILKKKKREAKKARQEKKGKKKAKKIKRETTD